MSDSPAAAAPARSSAFAKLRWIVPTAFLALTVRLVWQEIGTFPLIEVQRALLDVPTLPALGVALLAVFGVAFTGTVDFLIARWLSLGLHASDCFRLAFVANSLANTLNLSGAMGASIRLMGLSSLNVPLSR